MMPMTEFAEQKRPGGFLAGDKRLKTSCGGRGVSVKEKDRFGKRVAALQQLVSPFGKTDTASVLHEATSYIRFLHEQLQVLSKPYLLSKAPAGEPSLRSRGLCLVPVARTLAIARSNGADIWAPPGAA
ncbi:unnamed protein product [Spirodela intermedia]|uniref:BHLH domain-containing protein n=1 Tax=Spirodela intermedia TaxID=51605 RepID=A0A7I8JC13_SPIIN|nr:unnamed protein product [Spirodela intermedia]CAA6667727.1 unnamed protein product [Spirodela intermedia]